MMIVLFAYSIDTYYTCQLSRFQSRDDVQLPTTGIGLSAKVGCSLLVSW